jgi:hypothetical protein
LFDIFNLFPFNTKLTVNCIAGIVAKLQAARIDVGLWQELVICVFFKPSRLVLGSAVLSLGVKWYGQEGSLSLPSSNGKR